METSWVKCLDSSSLSLLINSRSPLVNAWLIYVIDSAEVCSWCSFSEPPYLGARGNHWFGDVLFFLGAHKLFRKPIIYVENFWLDMSGEPITNLLNRLILSLSLFVHLRSVTAFNFTEALNLFSTKGWRQASHDKRTPGFQTSFCRACEKWCESSVWSETSFLGLHLSFFPWHQAIS